MLENSSMEIREQEGLITNKMKIGEIIFRIIIAILIALAIYALVRPG